MNIDIPNCALNSLTQYQFLAEIYYQNYPNYKSHHEFTINVLTEEFDFDIKYNALPNFDAQLYA